MANVRAVNENVNGDVAYNLTIHIPRNRVKTNSSAFYKLTGILLLFSGLVIVIFPLFSFLFLALNSYEECEMIICKWARFGVEWSPRVAAAGLMLWFGSVCGYVAWLNFKSTKQKP